MNTPAIARTWWPPAREVKDMQAGLLGDMPACQPNHQVHLDNYREGLISAPTNATYCALPWGSGGERPSPAGRERKQYARRIYTRRVGWTCPIPRRGRGLRAGPVHWLVPCRHAHDEPGRGRLVPHAPRRDPRRGTVFFVWNPGVRFGHICRHDDESQAAHAAHGLPRKAAQDPDPLEKSVA